MWIQSCGATELPCCSLLPSSHHSPAREFNAVRKLPCHERHRSQMMWRTSVARASRLIHTPSPPKYKSGTTSLRPVAPKMPEEWECCGNGCDECIWSTYFTANAEYHRDLKAWNQANQDKEAPEYASAASKNAACAPGDAPSTR